VSRYQKGKTYFTAARDNQWQWHQLDCMQVCTSTDNHASTPPQQFEEQQLLIINVVILL